MARFDPNQHKAQIEAAVQRATGRALALNGPLRLTLTPNVTLAADDVALANIPGGSRPDMARVGRIEARLAVWPLLRGRLEIERVTLIRPDILLETDAAGHPNWRFHRLSTPSTAPVVVRSPSVPRLDIHNVQIRDGVLTWHDGRTGRSQGVDIAALDVSEPGPDAPITAKGTLRYQGQPVSIAAQLGSRARAGQGEGAPWPIHATLAAGGAQLAAEGGLTDPRHGRGLSLTLTGTDADLAQLAPFLPGHTLPPLRDVRFTAQLTQGADKHPRLTALTLHAGPSDLGALRPGLRLTALDLAAPRPDQPIRLQLAGTQATLPLTLSGTLGSLDAIQAAQPLAVALAGTAGAAKATAEGSIATPARLEGVALRLSGRVPDLAALAPLAGRPLPPLRDVSFHTALADRDGLAHGAALNGLALTAPQWDLAGDAVLGFRPRPSVRGNLTAHRLDTDALVAALAGPAALVLRHMPPPHPAARPAGHGVIPDIPLPFQALTGGDADLRLAIGALTDDGVVWRNLTARLLLQNGHLRLDPVSGQLPGGPFALSVDVDATRPAPPVALRLRAPGLALRPLLASLGLPSDDSGNLELDFDLRGAGDTTRALAAGLTGHAGVAMVNGSIDNRLLNATLGDVLRQAKLPVDIAGRSGHSDLRCLALRLDSTDGHASVRAFMLDMSRLRVSGTGTINLADETLALRLRPMAKVGGTGVIVPLRVEGTLAAPRLAVEPAAGPAETALALGARMSHANPARGALARSPEGDRLLHATDSGDCGPALALARDGHPGPMPAPPRPEKGPSLQDLLRGLVR